MCAEPHARKKTREENKAYRRRRNLYGSVSLKRVPFILIFWLAPTDRRHIGSVQLKIQFRMKLWLSRLGKTTCYYRFVPSALFLLLLMTSFDFQVKKKKKKEERKKEEKCSLNICRILLFVRGIIKINWNDWNKSISGAKNGYFVKAKIIINNNPLLNLGLRLETFDRILSIVYTIVYESELDRLTSFNNIVRKVECFYGVQQR